MTTPVVTRRIDVDTHFYPPVDYKALREYLPRGLLAQAQDMLVRDAMRAAEPDWVAAGTSMAWDIAGSAFGGRQVLYERFFAGDP